MSISIQVSIASERSVSSNEIDESNWAISVAARVRHDSRTNIRYSQEGEAANGGPAHEFGFPRATNRKVESVDNFGKEVPLWYFGA
jgi:hypothetical protein